ncbi:hypothetical protein GCK72_015883 [Caenorhabditis remanei]|uniref:TFIIH p62 subunit N-terminal domain-containing protein n=1 Tax=Caenorhabditis remanei TaxID=31234 RepID=A0A6A5GXQ5_CAERE|nr:hypothetical protein GCK72_015883 [Caenorhabditis remanei]KAF1759416.1 hypothetical protein GCK72_015883 [Caenorhabditis remanei]
MTDETEALISVDHVKYRKAGAGKSPVGLLAVFSDHIEWRDDASPEVFTWELTRIKGQRVSPPHKSKVQLQLVLTNDEQAIFVFLNPGSSTEELVKERDDVKHKLMHALILNGRREKERLRNLPVHNDDEVEDLNDYSSEDSVNVPVQTKLRNYRAHVGILQHQVNDREDTLIKRNSTIKDLETKLAAADQKLIEQELKLQKELAERDAKIRKLEIELEATYIVAKLPRDDRDMMELIKCNAQILSISAKLDFANSEIDELKKKYADVEAANENHLDTIRIQQSRIDKFQEALKEAGAEYDEMKDRMVEGEMECERQMTDYEIKIQELETTLEIQKLEIQKLEKEKIPEPTHLYIELGKLYVELQEAKRPHDDQLAVKDKEIEFFLKQLEAKDSEIQNLKDSVQMKMDGKDHGSEVMEKKAAIQDPVRLGVNYGNGDPDQDW